MIVDDEYYFREALKISLPWEELGFSICGEAKNGKDALEKVYELNPDIILVDINMPIMDGLEFVQEIRNRGSDSKIIILTGHSEFKYAKQALQLGVHNYILKPVNEKELANALNELKNVIESEANIRIEVNRLRRQVKENLPLLREKFLNELIQGNIPRDEKEIERKIAYLNLRLRSDYYRVTTIEINIEKKEQWKDEDLQLWKFAVSNIACELLGEHFTHEVCYDNNDRICIIIGANQSGSELQLMLESRLEAIRTAVSRHLDFTITIGVGNEKKTLFDIPASYKESLVALKNRLTDGKDRVISYCSIEGSEIRVNLFTAEHRNQLLIGMRTGDSNEVLGLISQIFRDIREENIHPEILYVICVEMISVCMEFLVETGLTLKEVLPNDTVNIIDEIQSKKSIYEMEKWVAGIFSDTLNAAKKIRCSKTSALIEGVKKYIRENYHREELSIDEMAKHLYVNYAHLCFLFKRDTGITINEYLTEFRMNRAKELFDGGNKLVLDVAARVGYADANYFGKCFKKYFGLAPSRYIENKNRFE